jgi:poly(A) polymerase
VSPPPAKEREAALAIVRRLRDAGHVAYFAGGCVRDELLGREPHDYDVVTDATPERIAQLLPGRTSHVGAHFGVVIAREQGRMIEVATFRTDGSYTDRRRPDSVIFSTPEQDARRRDFTVNAIFLDPLATPDESGLRGAVIDYVGGTADVKQKVIRAVGDPDQRLAEDDLRALRAARFAAKLSFSIDPATAQAIRRHASSLSGISRERIGDEFRMMMEHPSRAAAAGHVRALALEGPALLLASRDGDAFPLLASLAPDASCEQAFAAYAIDLGVPATERGGVELASTWRKALCLSNEEQAALKFIFSHVEILESRFFDLGVAAQKRLGAKWRFDDAIALVERRHPSLGERLRARLGELNAHAGGIGVAPLVNGDDLIALGMPPGPKFKKVLDHLYDEQLEGRLTTVEAARALARTFM